MASASAGALRVVVDALLGDGNAELYRQHEGMCLEHVLGAAATAEPPTLKILCERLLTSLREADDIAPELLAGIDDDAPRRARWRAELPVWPAGPSTLEAVYAGFDIEACPVCLASALMDRRYVQWFIEGARAHDPSITRDPGELCAIHLHDLARGDRQAVRAAVARKRSNQIGKLSALLDRLRSLPAPARRSRRAPADPIETPREEFISTLHCPACRARDLVDRRQLELICASLALGPVRERYEHSHGLCLGHVTQMPEGDAAELARPHLEARLGVLAWEVDETARKYAWRLVTKRRVPSAAHRCAVWCRSTGVYSRVDPRPTTPIAPTERRWSTHDGARVMGASQQLGLDDVTVRSSRILDEVERVIVGKRAALELALCALLADGHVLIAEDSGGVAGGNAGAPGHHRGAHPCAGAAISRVGDPESNRVRGHLSTARGAA